MAPTSELADKQGSLRFATIWTGVNALLVLVGAARAVIAGSGTQPGATLAILLVFLLVTVIGLLRIRSLKRQIDGLKQD